MKDYAEMSDFEINKLVAIANGYPHDDCDIAKLNNSMVGVEWDDDTGYATKTLDYCNNPADAWPIITENRISTIYLDENEWGCRGDGDKSACRAINSNALRCAMIAFLMMKEKEND